MPKEDEKLAAILAEMRGAAKSTDLFNGEEVGEPLIRGTKVEEWADRIEAAVKREMNEAAEFINDYLQEIPVCRKPHDWLVRNGYTDTSYQNAVFAEEKGGGAE